MLPLSKRPHDLALSLVHIHDSLSAKDWFLIRCLYIFLPPFFYVFLTLCSLSWIIILILIIILLSLLALLYAISIFIWIYKKDSGSEEMKNIALNITEGSEGFFVAQYGTIMKLSFLFAIIIVTIYYFRDNSNNGIEKIIGKGWMSLFSGVSFLIGAGCSALAGYAGMWVSVRANVR